MKDLRGKLKTGEDNMILPLEAKVIKRGEKLNGTSFFSRYYSYDNIKLVYEDPIGEGPSEKFWASIESIEPDHVVAKINNDLIYVPEELGVDDGDIIKVSFDSIYAVI